LRREKYEKTPRFSSSKGKTSVVKITGSVWDEFHREMTLKPVPSDRRVMCLHSFCKNYISVQKILLDPQNNPGFATFLLVSLVLFHLLLSVRKVSASNHGREAGYTNCDST